MGISGGSERKPTMKLSAAAAPYVPSSFTAPTAPVETRAERGVVRALASSMAEAGAGAGAGNSNFMSFAMNALTKVSAVAMDCEMVGVGEGGRKSALAHIAIVDINGKILMNEYVIPKGGISTITDYRTPYSGIKAGNLDHLDKKKQSFNNVKKRALKILDGRTIVGHALINDFMALDLKMDEYITWDTAVKEEYLRTHPYYGKQPRKLKNLAAEIGNIIQAPKPDRKGHNPVEDARASMNLYRHYVLKLPKIEYANMSR